MSSSGQKRTRSEIEHEEQSQVGGLPYGDIAERPAPAHRKPKDWREAFLDEDDDARPSSKAGSSRSNGGHDKRDGHGRVGERTSSGYGNGNDRFRNDRDRYSRHEDRHSTNSRDNGHGNDYRRRNDDDRRNGGKNRDERYTGNRRDHDHKYGTDKHMSPIKRDDRSNTSTSVIDPEEGEVSDSSTKKHPISTIPSDIRKPTSTVSTEASTEPIHISNAEEPVDLDQVLEERRKRRRELLEKFAGTTSTAQSSVDGGKSVVSTDNAESIAGVPSSTARLGIQSVQSIDNTIKTPSIQTPTPTQTFDLTKLEQGDASAKEILPAETRASDIDGEVQISAADYNPIDDRKADDDKAHKLATTGSDLNKDAGKQAVVASGVGEPVTVTNDEKMMDVDPEEDEYEEVEVDDEEDEEFDMFAMDSEPKPKKKIMRKKKRDQNPTGKVAPVIPVVDVSTLIDNFDDSEGYYRLTPGEILDGGKYQLSTNLGKGMFSAVIRAKVLKATEKEEVVGGEVAIKVIRSQESMYVAGRKEAQILNKLKNADPEDKKHVIRLIRTFEHRGHLCLVTESMSMNLRDVVKRFGKDVGLNLRAVRAYAHQMFLALSLMKKCNIVHADIKPDNILVTENKAVLKICDLGSACDVSEGDITPYLVSRFYRAPEIILGLPYDEALDMWSIGCTLYELYTGKILFPGRSNNQMLHLMMDLKGKFSHKMIKKATFGNMHFDEGLNFVGVEKDKITGADIIKTVIINKATRDLKTRLVPSSSTQMKMKDEDVKLLLSFVDLLDKCLMLDPSRRLNAREALTHPFLSLP